MVDKGYVLLLLLAFTLLSPTGLWRGDLFDFHSLMYMCVCGSFWRLRGLRYLHISIAWLGAHLDGYHLFLETGARDDGCLLLFSFLYFTFTFFLSILIYSHTIVCTFTCMDCLRTASSRLNRCTSRLRILWIAAVFSRCCLRYLTNPWCHLSAV